jgi:hypothetical protein
MFHVFSWGLPYIATLINAKQIYPNRLAPGDYPGFQLYKWRFLGGLVIA